MKSLKSNLAARWFVLLLCAAGALVSPCAARDHVDGFDDAKPTWRVIPDQSNVRVLRQVRSRAFVHQGEAAELLEIDSPAAGAHVELECDLPAARLIDELALSLWFHSSQDGVTLALRVVLPQQIDPRTGGPMSLVLDGDAYDKPGHWQKLTCGDLPARLGKALPKLRKSLAAETGMRQPVNTTGAHVVAAVLQVRMGRGVSQFAIDDLRLDYVVEAEPAREIQTVADSSLPRALETEVGLEGLRVLGRPCFPRIAAYHDESVDDLVKMRLSTLWIPDYRDSALLGELQAAGLHAMAVPPRPTAGNGAHLAPFGPETAAIRFWYLGTRIPASAHNELEAWVEQIRSADQELQRPVMGDVAGRERSYSRQLNMLSVSRNPLFSSFGLKSYRDWLIERKLQAYPGSFVSTWVHVEPPAALARQRAAGGFAPVVVEPEQIRLQVYGALAAGCRGIGYWSHAPLDGDGPGDYERRLTIALLNMELELLEPWLATASPSGQEPFKVKLPPLRNTRALLTPGGGSKSSPRNQRERDALLNENDDQKAVQDLVSRELEAAVLRTGTGLLVLPIWYGSDAQFVPDRMAANSARIVVPGTGEAARAFEITPTRVSRLDPKPVAGGREIILEKFDLTAAILFTDDMSLVERLEAKVQSIAEASSRISLELARAKLERVAEVDRQLRERRRGLPDGNDILAAARRRLDEAESAWQMRRFDHSRTHSADCMQYLRILQRAHWNDAVRVIYSPVSSPHALCFQTLPDHWDMIDRFNKARETGGPNLLRSGDFEDYDTWVSEGGRHEQTKIEGILAAAELSPRRHSGNYSLRLIAAPATGKDPPRFVNERPVTVTTPPVTIYKGQIVSIRGWVKVSAPSLGNLDGAMLYDSIGGPTTALRWKSPADWQLFQIVREATETGDLTLTMTLTGLGEISFDDLEIVPLDPNAAPLAEGKKGAPAARPVRGRPLDFFKNIPTFGGKSDGGK